MWDEKHIGRLNRYKQRARKAGGAERLAKQHEKGKLTARERIELLFDSDTFVEMGEIISSRGDAFGGNKNCYLGDGVITGYGNINGRLTFASSEDFTVQGGTMGEAHLRKICRIMDMAYDMRAPFISINDSGGARIEEGILGLAELGGVFYRNTKCSGVIPQIAVIMGPCAGGACYSPAICDFVFMVKDTGMMFITGPDVIKAVTGEQIDARELGGVQMHAMESGAAHFVYENDKSCLKGVRALLTYLPQNYKEDPPPHTGTPMDLSRGLQQVVVDDQRKCYDMHAVIGAIIDKNSFFEVHTEFARNALTGFARVEGESVGFVANQPNYMGGALDVHASDKIARFVRTCDCFNIPIITLVDVPAFLPGKRQEELGIIRHGAKMLYAYSEASVPKITLILRKAYGGAYIAMGSKGIGADIAYAWPIAQIAVMGAEGAVNIVYRKQMQEADDLRARKEHLIKEYEDRFMNPYMAAKMGYIDEIIYPEDTARRIKSALHMLKRKERSIKIHGNIPL